MTLLPALAPLEIDAGDDAHSPVGELFGMVEDCVTGGGSGELEVVEAKEVIEKWAAAAAAAAGKRKGGILVGTGGMWGWWGKKWGLNGGPVEDEAAVIVLLL